MLTLSKKSFVVRLYGHKILWTSIPLCLKNGLARYFACLVWVPFNHEVCHVTSLKSYLLLQVRGLPQDLHPGDPVCAPKHTVIAEECIQILRKLHSGGSTKHPSLYHSTSPTIHSWTKAINKEIHRRLVRLSLSFDPFIIKLKMVR